MAYVCFTLMYFSLKFLYIFHECYGNIRFFNYKTIMSPALLIKNKKTTTKRQKITLRGAANLLFYTFSFYDIFLLYLHCLYLFSWANRIKLKDFVEYVCENDHFGMLKMGLFDVVIVRFWRFSGNDYLHASRVAWKAMLAKEFLHKFTLLTYHHIIWPLLPFLDALFERANT